MYASGSVLHTGGVIQTDTVLAEQGVHSLLQVIRQSGVENVKWIL
jgi:hypothetical protein